MPNTISALKRMRQIRRRTAINQIRKSRLRNQIKRLRKLIAAKDYQKALAELPKTYSIIDRAVKWGIIKDNTADRYKSRLTRHVKALAPAA